MSNSIINRLAVNFNINDFLQSTILKHKISLFTLLDNKLINLNLLSNLMQYNYQRILTLNNFKAILYELLMDTLKKNKETVLNILKENSTNNDTIAFMLKHAQKEYDNFCIDNINTEFINALCKKYFIFLNTGSMWIQQLSKNKIWLNTILLGLAASVSDRMALQCIEEDVPAKKIIEHYNNASNNFRSIRSLAVEAFFDIYEQYILYVHDINQNLSEGFLVPLALNNDELAVIFKYLMNPENLKVITNNVLNKKRIQSKINAYTIDLDTIQLEIGESMPLSSDLLHTLSHTEEYVPIIYVNGNIIVGKNTSSIADSRQRHIHLFDEYLHNMDLHANDIVEKTPEEWAKIEATDENMLTYQCNRAVQKANQPSSAIAIFADCGNAAEAAAALSNKFHCRVFLTSDDMLEIIRKAKLTGKRIKLANLPLKNQINPFNSLASRLKRKVVDLIGS